MNKTDLILSCFALACASAGCSKDKPPAQGAGTADAETPTVSAASATGASAAPAAPAPEAKTAAAVTAATYKGSYTATPSTYYIPSEKDYGAVKQVKDEPTKMVGEGTFSITVGEGGRVSGEIESGPAAPGVIDGVVTGDTLTATVRRKQKDEGLTGALVGKVTADGVEGSMRLADASAALLREAKLTAKKAN
jgi:hypothetical protein